MDDQPSHQPAAEQDQTVQEVDGEPLHDQPVAEHDQPVHTADGVPLHDQPEAADPLDHGLPEGAIRGARRSSHALILRIFRRNKSTKLYFVNL